MDDSDQYFDGANPERSISSVGHSGRRSLVWDILVPANTDDDKLHGHSWIPEQPTIRLLSAAGDIMS